MSNDTPPAENTSTWHFPNCSWGDREDIVLAKKCRDDAIAVVRGKMDLSLDGEAVVMAAVFTVLFHARAQRPLEEHLEEHPK